MSQSSHGNRPLSPHLQIYKWQWTMTYSILNRATGVALSAGAVLMAAWVITLAFAPDMFNALQALLATPIGVFCLVGWTWSLFYHMFQGVRHMFWDSVMGFDLTVAARTGHLVFGLSVLFTAVTFGFVFWG